MATFSGIDHIQRINLIFGGTSSIVYRVAYLIYRFSLDYKDFSSILYGVTYPNMVYRFTLKYGVTRSNIVYGFTLKHRVTRLNMVHKFVLDHKVYLVYSALYPDLALVSSPEYIVQLYYLQVLKPSLLMEYLYSPSLYLVLGHEPALYGNKKVGEEVQDQRSQDMATLSFQQ